MIDEPRHITAANYADLMGLLSQWEKEGSQLADRNTHDWLAGYDTGKQSMLKSVIGAIKIFSRSIPQEGEVSANSLLDHMKTQHANNPTPGMKGNN